MKETAITAIERSRIIAIIRGVPAERLGMLLKVLYSNGVLCAELAFGGDSDLETARHIEKLTGEADRFAFIGAGTVTSLERVKLAASAGASFIVAPNTDAEIIAQAHALGMAAIPGAFTPSEICSATAAGADFIKVFPSNFFGPDYIRSLRAPLPEAKLMPFGAVTSENLADYFAAGAFGAGIGGSFTSQASKPDCCWEKISAEASLCSKIVCENT